MHPLSRAEIAGVPYFHGVLFNVSTIPKNHPSIRPARHLKSGSLRWALEGKVKDQPARRVITWSSQARWGTWRNFEKTAGQHGQKKHMEQYEVKSDNIPASLSGAVQPIKDKMTTIKRANSQGEDVLESEDFKRWGVGRDFPSSEWQIHGGEVLRFP